MRTTIVVLLLIVVWIGAVALLIPLLSLGF
jgi:hypothetical protein